MVKCLFLTSNTINIDILLVQFLTWKYSLVQNVLFSVSVLGRQLNANSERTFSFGQESGEIRRCICSHNVFKKYIYEQFGISKLVENGNIIQIHEEPTVDEYSVSVSGIII